MEKLISSVDPGAEILPIEDKEVPAAIKRNDTIYIGYPIQFSNAPYMVRDLIQNNSYLWKNKSVLCISPFTNAPKYDIIKERGAAKMIRKKDKQEKFYSVTYEELIPKEHFLRKLDILIDFDLYMKKPHRCIRISAGVRLTLSC